MTAYGIHADMAAADYHATEAASASQLRKLWQSTPAHLRAELDAKDKPTPAMQMGTLAHSIILEPDKPLPGIVIQPEEYEPGKKWTRAAKVCKDWHAEQERAGLLVLKADEYDAAFCMANSIAGHPIASALLAKGRSEVSIIAHDTANKVDVRARMDFLPDGLPAIVDVKSTLDASERAFARKAYEMGYHIQAAFYLDLWNSQMPTEPRTEFYFVTVENSAPFSVNVFQAAPEFIARGREDYRHALATYARCLAEDHWPAYPAMIQTLNLPTWA